MLQARKPVDSVIQAKLRPALATVSRWTMLAPGYREIKTQGWNENIPGLWVFPAGAPMPLGDPWR
jgi:hypothetical protein